VINARTWYHVPGTFFWLKVPITREFADRLIAEHTKPWFNNQTKINDGAIKWDCSAHFATVPEFEALGFVMQRVEAYDLTGDRPWYSIACDVDQAPDDELKMVLLLKYDINYECAHVIAF
jgi:hypothetical protein